MRAVTDATGYFTNRQCSVAQQLHREMQASTADVIHRRLSAFGHEPCVQARAGQPGHARRVGDLQRIGGVLLDVRIQRGVGQATRAEFGRLRVIETGQQQHRALLRDQRIADRTVRQPVDQLALPESSDSRPG